MSTAGKVLSALVLVMAVAWVLLAAAVTELNRNGAKAVEEQQAKYKELEEDIASAQRSLQQLKDAAHMEQFYTQSDLTKLEVRQADVEKARSHVIEMLTRVKLQIDSLDATVKAAEANKEQRQDDKMSETEAIAKLESEVETLKGQNSELLSRLTSLRDSFKSTLQSNKEMIGRLQSSSASQPGSSAGLVPTRR
jgi:chromosome segregation ATPase